MINPSVALSPIPAGLREPLVDEYRSILQSFLEQRWLPSELSGGRFSEIVWSILDGHGKGTYPPTPSKPADFVGACRSLEKNAHEPRSFQILIPRLLPALYEIRNNRNVGHVGGDVDPNHMDAVVVVSICNWVMGELIRVFHNLTIAEAQKIVDALVEVRVPVVWSDGNVKRVLRPELRLPDQILLLVSSCVPDVAVAELLEWTEFKNKKYFMRTLRKLHQTRLVEFTEPSDRVKLLPPGANAVRDLISRRKLLIG